MEPPFARSAVSNRRAGTTVRARASVERATFAREHERA
jgi:hypothetical protein